MVNDLSDLTLATTWLFEFVPTNELSRTQPLARVGMNCCDLLESVLQAAGIVLSFEPGVMRLNRGTYSFLVSFYDCYFDQVQKMEARLDVVFEREHPAQLYHRLNF